MILRRTTDQDIPQVMAIIEQGKNYLKSNGIDQWQNGYPNEEIIKQDIVDGYGYVLEAEGQILGTVALSFDGEPWYDDITNGKWLTNEDFLVIHRMALSNEARGTTAASEIIKQAEQLCTKCAVRSIKIDTHEDNIIMQKLVKKTGFTYCGTVILGSEGKRLAFEKVI
ncbi:MAG: GNAT family N-acetyltransferase [Turicibacter sp.]|nr:GNAT family N-acetyltransferase [Turicibacter sp.]